MSTLTITTIQSDLVWEDKTANLQQFEHKIRNINSKTEVVVLPEMFSTGFSMQPELLAETMEGETVAWMKRVSAENNIILTGSLIIEEDGNYFNRLIWMLPNGQYGQYDKRHLFAYGKEDEHYRSGNKRLIASVKGWKINLLVCYDLRFPVWARQQHKEDGAEYDLLIYVANWPERRSHAWKTLLCARAIENQCYVVGVNRIGNDGNEIHYAGDSMIVDPMGAIVYSPEGRNDIFTYTLTLDTLNKTREKLPFLKDADSFLLGI